jgi:Ca2+/H+ antiporter, TMEM165/GDT1 family
MVIGRYVVCLATLSLLSLAAAEDGDESKVAADSTAWSFPAFAQAFGESVAVIVATEIGDRTFFIAAIMAMRHSRLIVWAGAVGALVVMTVLSTLVGHVAPLLIPKVYTHYAAAALFLYFGVKMLREGFSISHAGASSRVAMATRRCPTSLPSLPVPLVRSLPCR